MQRMGSVLGIKPEQHADRAAHYVPEYLKGAGYEIVPVPVYYPDVTEILGEQVYRTVAEVPGDIDMVVVFRKPNDVTGHVDDIIAARPKSVWFQLGIRHDEVAAELIAADGAQRRDRTVESQLAPACTHEVLRLGHWTNDLEQTRQFADLLILQAAWRTDLEATG